MARSRIPTIYLVILVALIVVSVQRGLAIEHHVVGDDINGWDTSTDISSWSSGRLFKVGDIIWFTNTASQESVVELESIEELSSCDLSNPIKMFTHTLNKVQLDGEGTRFFASANFESCKKGLKIHVNVHPKEQDLSQNDCHLSLVTNGKVDDYSQAPELSPTPTPKPKPKPKPKRPPPPPPPDVGPDYDESSPSPSPSPSSTPKPKPKRPPPPPSDVDPDDDDSSPLSPSPSPSPSSKPKPKPKPKRPPPPPPADVDPDDDDSSPTPTPKPKPKPKRSPPPPSDVGPDDDEDDDEPPPTPKPHPPPPSSSTMLNGHLFPMVVALFLSYFLKF